MLTADQIINACKAPDAAVHANWPLIVAALQEFGVDSDLVEAAAAGTIAIETWRTFEPIQERGGVDYFTRLYEHRTDLGNVNPGDGARFHGRGFVQITGRVNYRTFGHALGVDLEGNPELALDPGVSARVLALFFKTHHVADHANAQDWPGARLRVNGGTNGLTEFEADVNALLGVLNGTV